MIAWVGFALPFLISAKDSMYVIIGIFITVLVAPAVAIFTIDIIKDLIEEKKQD
jgi:hypothetical protein